MFWCVRASCLCWQYSLDKEALKSQQKILRQPFLSSILMIMIHDLVGGGGGEWVKGGRQCPNWHYQNFHLIAMKKAIYIKNNNNNNYNDTHYLLLRITLLSADGALCGGEQPATFLNKSSLLVAGSLSSLYHPLAFIIVLSPLILTLDFHKCNIWV